MFLQNFDSINHYFNLETEQTVYSNTKEKTSGWYREINGLVSALFVTEHKLYTIWRRNRFLIDKSCIVIVEKTESLDKKIFKLYCDDNLIFQFIYEVEEELNQAAPFDYIDNEDFDWGLFLANIINTPTRKTAFIEYFTQN
jgi:hypothetical protein